MRRQLGLLAVVAALSVAACSGGDDDTDTGADVGASGDGPGNAWAALDDAPTARQEVAAAVVDGRIWVVGGFVGREGSTLVEVYDPAADAWEAGPDLPHAVHHAMAAELGGELIVAGGYTDGPGGWVPTNRAFVLRGGAWEELAPMPEARGAGAAASAGGRLVVVGGTGGDGGHVGPVAVFDGEGWTAGAAIPTLRDHLAAASDGTAVYAVGGRVGGLDRNLAALERYDPAADAWEELPDMPTPRGGLGAAFAGGRLVVVGGESPDGTNEEVEAFEPAGARWTALADLPTPRHGLGVAVVGDTLYVLVGGTVPGFGADATVESLRLR
jgi:N-acetylneuraminic acid mutarotase